MPTLSTPLSYYHPIDPTSNFVGDVDDDRYPIRDERRTGKSRAKPYTNQSGGKQRAKSRPSFSESDRSESDGRKPRFSEDIAPDNSFHGARSPAGMSSSGDYLDNHLPVPPLTESVPSIVTVDSPLVPPMDPFTGRNSSDYTSNGFSCTARLDQNSSNTYWEPSPLRHNGLSDASWEYWGNSPADTGPSSRMGVVGGSDHNRISASDARPSRKEHSLSTYEQVMLDVELLFDDAEAVVANEEIGRCPNQPV